MLRRKTPLKRKSWLQRGWVRRAVKHVVEEAAELTVQVRQQIIYRAARCEYCAHPFGADPDPNYRAVVHHVFYRSHLWKLVKHEPWNLVALHDLCHRKAHTVPAVRDRLEIVALQRLYIFLGPERVKEVLTYERGSTHSAFVRAYEHWRRQNRGALAA